MAEIIAGVGTSHVPAVGVAMDQGRTKDDVWASYFEKVEPAREWMAKTKPDVCIIVYNDHASAFSLELIPTFVIGTAGRFRPADEGFGRRPVPDVEGHPDMAWHMAESLILNEFDMTIANKMDVDHGLTVPLSVMYGQPDAWPCKVIPICVNVVQYPPPTGKRCYDLGKAIREAVESFPGNERVAILGTGGLSHQLQAERAGLINQEYDREFLDRIISDPEAQAAVTHTEYMREAGSEGIEMVMWMVMRGAMNENVTELYRAMHVPTSNTSNGLIILENDHDQV